MSTQKITCPKCGYDQIEVTEILSAQIKSQMEADLKGKEDDLAKKEKELKILSKKTQQEVDGKLAIAKKKMESAYDNKLKEESEKLFKELDKKAKAKNALELRDLKNQNEENTKKLEDAQQRELDLRKQTRELEEQKKNIELDVQRKVDSQIKDAEKRLKEEASEESRLKVAEKDKQIQIMKKNIEDLKRNAEQGSMQIQGEVQEDDLKEILTQSFPYDKISDVPTGMKGADVVQIVHSEFGKPVGQILWESKRTKAWQEPWIKKLKQDQGAAKADIAVIATQTVPEGIANFDFYKGVWIIKYDPAYISAFTQVLRHSLYELNKVKDSMVHKDEKMETLYKYISGTQFKNRIENVVMAFNSMKGNLDQEKRAMTRIWARRDKELGTVLDNFSGLYGDLQGVTSLQSIPALELPAGVTVDE